MKTFEEHCRDRIPHNAPTPVRAVATALLRNCSEAAQSSINDMQEKEDDAQQTINFWMNRPYIYFTANRNGSPAWVICDNYDAAASLIFYPETPETNSWAYFPCYGDDESPQSFEQSMSNASILYTG